MRVAIEEKKKIVEDLKEKIKDSTLIVLADFQGLSFEEMRCLQKELKKERAVFRVAKNTLIRKAIAEKDGEGFSPHLVGNTGLLLGREDPIAPLKILVNFIKKAEKGRIKAGMVENSFLEEKELRELAKLPAKEILLAKMIGGFQAPLWGLVMVLGGLMRKLVYALKAVKEKKEKEKDKN